MVNFMFGVILLILIVDGSFVKFFSVVCVEMYFLIYLIIFLKWVSNKIINCRKLRYVNVIKYDDINL